MSEHQEDTSSLPLPLRVLILTNSGRAPTVCMSTTVCPTLSRVTHYEMDTAYKLSTAGLIEANQENNVTMRSQGEHTQQLINVFLLNWPVATVTGMEGGAERD